MKVIWLKKRSLSYRTRMILTFVLINMLTAGILAGTTGVQIYNYMERETQERVEQMVDYLNITMNKFFDDLQRLTVLPLYEQNLIDILVRYANNNTAVLFNKQRQIMNFLNSINYDKTIISYIRLYMMNGDYFQSNGNSYKWKKGSLQWMELCEQNCQQTYMIPEDDTITVCRALGQPLYGTQMGYIQIQLKPNAITDLIMESSLPEGSEVYILNEFNQCIYPLHADIESINQIKTENSKYCYSIITSDKSRLSIMAQLSTQNIEEMMKQLFVKLFIILFIVLLIGCVLTWYMSTRLIKPIVNLKTKMELVGAGRFDTRMVVESKDEIGQLEGMFNNMTESVETLIHEVYEKSLASKEAQISAMQSQINPHFLYNTLETINMMSVSAGNYDISEAVSSLGRMMRYCVSNEEHFATLEEEIRFVNDYYDIQKLRFEDLHSLRIDVEQGCEGLMVPKLLLQPFVENIVQHGMGGGIVDIVLQVYLQQQDIIITVENNGLPLTLEEQKKLEGRLFKAVQPQENLQGSRGKGYGLANVHRRLQLIYGENYGVFIDKEYISGARFIIKLKGRDINVQGYDC